MMAVGEAVTAVHKVSNLSQTSHRRLLLLIDEVDAFLGGRVMKRYAYST